MSFAFNRTPPNTASFRRRPVFKGGLYLVTDNSTAFPAVSTDGVTWQLATKALPSAGAWTIAGGWGSVIALISGGSPQCAYTPV